MLKDWAEATHHIDVAERALYQAILNEDYERALRFCDEILIAAREVRAWINDAQERRSS
jgi:hypothetical protein